ncbi:MAG: alanine--tRNA ligase [Saprospiraceae bacterium]|nr:alanine--tRNA ligase [Saprospiraceae bacterium]
MNASEIRNTFFAFFEGKGHKIVPSAPIVNKTDPTLLFTNAGMNQFKDYFLGNHTPPAVRIADTQKCLRVSGKHNDLEEVGTDGYHHTMFEMLGNWSFGDYFKEEAIAWGWELLVDIFKIDPSRLYATVFEGDASDNLDRDMEATTYWSKWLPPERILPYGREDNFWEMGDTGPCGPCSEIHIDLRSEKDRREMSGAKLVNTGHAQVVEIWNLVFIQFNRKRDGSLEELPAKHVDTGMGFERLCLTLQSKMSSYDTDLFTPYIRFIEETSGMNYTGSYEADAKSDIAMRVIADHIRAVAFTIADGVIPSNTGAGYVIRRILRRAVRYYFSFLNLKEPLLHNLFLLVADEFKDAFPELKEQEQFIKKVILEEEKSFLHTLDLGLRRLDQLQIIEGTIQGEDAFELFDTYGFPIDLTRLIAGEQGMKVDEAGFEQALAAQRSRSKADAEKQVGDWTVVGNEQEVQFVGYDELSVVNTEVIKYRTIQAKGEDQFQLVLSKTPFYAEGGGQVGDRGILTFGDEEVRVNDTVRENDLFIHILDRWPSEFAQPVEARVDIESRRLTENNHTATHLLHAALKMILGNHVNQKGSLVNKQYLRFDFSHFQKMTQEEVERVEHLVNNKVRENIARIEARSIAIDKARESGAMMLFGEKYGDEVRMITFDPQYSVELCGGCHVSSTGKLGFFKILSESGIAAGVRRIEAVTADAAEDYVNEQLSQLNTVRGLFKSPTEVAHQVEKLIVENKQLQKQVESLVSKNVSSLKEELKAEVETLHGVNFLAKRIQIKDTKAIKSLSYQIEKEVGNAFIVFGTEINSKPQLMVTISTSLNETKNMHAGNIIRDLAKEIEGGGGGQPFFATAGGKKLSGLDAALLRAKSFVTEETN